MYWRKKSHRKDKKNSFNYQDHVEGYATEDLEMKIKNQIHRLSTAPHSFENEESARDISDSKDFESKNISQSGLDRNDDDDDDHYDDDYYDDNHNNNVEEVPKWNSGLYLSYSPGQVARVRTESGGAPYLNVNFLYH